jgi:Zn-dependent protease
MILVINGLNLLPVPPLDGGQVMPLLLRRFGQKVVTAVSLLLVLAGAALAWWMSSILMLVLIVALGTMIALNPPRGVVRPAMSIGATLAVLLAYLALLAAHIALVIMITDMLELTDWFEQLANGPF